MLVLRRKVGENIVMTGGITISILEVSGNRVKIGISAPDDIRIVREELLLNVVPLPELPAIPA